MAIDFFASLKVCILIIFYNECRRYLDILNQNLLKDTDVITLDFHQLYLELLAFHAKNSIDSTSVSVQH